MSVLDPIILFLHKSAVKIRMICKESSKLGKRTELRR